MNIVSLFSGAGGLDLGFIMAGHKVVWANDLYKDAVQTYKKNIGDHIICKDIKNVSINEIPDCDILVGGFPCQGFSVANTKRSEKDKRNELYKELVRVIAGKKPHYFLVENVKGLVSFSKGAVLQMILEDFQSLGYMVSYRVLNTADYGVPQKRERIIIVGVREDISKEYSFPLQTHSKNCEVVNTEPWVSCGMALSNIPNPDMPNNLPNHVYSKYKLTFNGYLGHRMINPNAPSPTVTARGDEKGGVVVLHHPNNMRRMSCRELAEIQSFPLNYEFAGTKSSVYRQIANAVPPLFALAIAKQFSLE